MSRFGNTAKGRSEGFVLIQKTHKIKDPTDRRKGQRKARLLGRNEKTIQRNAAWWLRIATMAIANSHTR
jgi:hypothetical protein